MTSTTADRTASSDSIWLSEPIQARIENLLDDMSLGDLKVFDAAMTELESFGHHAVAPLLRVMCAPLFQIGGPSLRAARRMHAALAFVLLADRSFTTVAEQILADESDTIRNFVLPCQEIIRTRHKPGWDVITPSSKHARVLIAVALESLGANAWPMAGILTRALQDPVPQVRYFSASALAKIGRHARCALPQLAIMLSTDASPVNRIVAAHALGNMTLQYSGAKALQAALDARWSMLRRFALVALASLDPKLLPRDVEWVRRANVDRYRARCARFLNTIKHMQLVEVFIDFPFSSLCALQRGVTQGCNAIRDHQPHRLGRMSPGGHQYQLGLSDEGDTEDSSHAGFPRFDQSLSFSFLAELGPGAREGLIRFINDRGPGAREAIAAKCLVTLGQRGPKARTSLPVVIRALARRCSTSRTLARLALRLIEPNGGIILDFLPAIYNPGTDAEKVIAVLFQDPSLNQELCEIAERLRGRYGRYFREPPEEIVNDFLVWFYTSRLHRDKTAGFKPELYSKFNAWIARILRNWFLNEAEKRVRQARHTVSFDFPDGCYCDPHSISGPEDQAQLNELLAGLDPLQRAVILHKADGHSAREIATSLSISELKVAAVIRSVRRKLR
jgi:DNA-directed RNA polymerase specialized sigma24 family protein